MSHEDKSNSHEDKSNSATPEHVREAKEEIMKESFRSGLRYKASTRRSRQFVRRCVLGVCAMSKKCFSDPMIQILVSKIFTRLRHELYF
eukprot:g71964.t1